jgi:hypothetical protein
MKLTKAKQAFKMTKAKPKPKARPIAAPLPFHNIITREMADKHAVRVKARSDRIAAEQANSYQTEYNNIAGTAYRGGANAQQATAFARRHFAGMHGHQHLPK